MKEKIDLGSIINRISSSNLFNNCYTTYEIAIVKFIITVILQ